MSNDNSSEIIMPTEIIISSEQNNKVYDWGQEQYRKEKQREYYRERDKKNNERLDRLDGQIKILSSNIERMLKLKEKEVQIQSKQQNNNYENDFNAQIRQMQNERHYREQQRENDINYVGDLEYSLFCAWCNAFRDVIVPGTENLGGKLDIERMKTESYVNPQFFKEYCEQEYPNGFKRKISDERIKRFIGEKYFGYEYYTDDNGKLRARKKPQ